MKELSLLPITLTIPASVTNPDLLVKLISCLSVTSVLPAYDIEAPLRLGSVLASISAASYNSVGARNVVQGDCRRD
jgi:hypothetical protein